ncbi:MAG TPA: hypothetical protein VH723_03650 [Candidatus Limnocylindrales bacterium]|jgi:hypothetical protein
MAYETQIFLLFAAATVGLLAAMAVILRERREAAAAAGGTFAASTEGEKRCPYCAMGNLWIDRNCISCGRRLPG